MQRGTSKQLTANCKQLVTGEIFQKLARSENRGAAEAAEDQEIFVAGDDDSGFAFLSQGQNHVVFGVAANFNRFQRNNLNRFSSRTNLRSAIKSSLTPNAVSFAENFGFKFGRQGEVRFHRSEITGVIFGRIAGKENSEMKILVSITALGLFHQVIKFIFRYGFEVNFIFLSPELSCLFAASEEAVEAKAPGGRLYPFPVLGFDYMASGPLRECCHGQ